jgi:hypothetical protein
MLSNDQLAVKLGHSRCLLNVSIARKADVDPRIAMSQKCQKRL